MQALARSFFPVLNILGAVVALFAFSLLVPLGFAFFGGDRGLAAYDTAFLVTLGSGAAVYMATRHFKRELQPRDGFLLVTLVWTVLPAFGALPLWLHLPGLSFTDAYFEAMSGLTATGATVLTGLDDLPLSINVWRHLLQWFGGMGIIVLAVAILPLLGVGGSQMYRAEMSGPLKESKLTPRIAETAKGLYTIYFTLSATCFLAYRLGGMSWTDALMHMFSTMGLGGFSSHDASFAFFDSAALEAIAALFMMLAGVNFALHFTVWRHRTPLAYLQDTETCWYFSVVLAGALLVLVLLLSSGDYAADVPRAWRHAMFNTVSLATTTGYTSVDYEKWPLFAPMLLLFLGTFSTCAGSTGGGIKMVRALILLKQARRELVRILHPRVIAPVRMNNKVVENNVIFAVLAFMLIYGAATIAITFALLALGLDPVTAFTATVGCINNIGPGLAGVGPSGHYGGLTDAQTWVCAFAMLIGRLELMSVLVLFTPDFWRK
jgi:trk system potassium uptake protein TrkH